METCSIYGDCDTRGKCLCAGSPAAQAGLRPHDIITHIGETAIDESHSCLNSLFKYQPGETIGVTFVRGGEPMQVEVTLGESMGD